MTERSWRERFATRKAPSKETLSAWDSKGRVLLARLRDELGQEFFVGYMDQKTGEVE